MSILSQTISFFPSSTLKGYKILSKLSTGGFSEVFLAESNETNQKVVIKAPLKTESSSSDLRKEAFFMQKLKGIAGVPLILESIINESQEVLIIQKLGDSMQKIIQEHMNLSLKSMIMIGVQILATLKEMHEKGIIHRDVKPSNILACDSNPNQIYLIDYGLAKSFIKNGSHQFFETKKKTFKGTAMFASRNAHFCNSLSRRDDLESLAYTLAFLYKGSLPWSSFQNKMKRNYFELGKIKQYWIEKGVFPDMPVEFQHFVEYIRKLSFEETPNYKFLSNLLLDMAKRYDFKLESNRWEWSNSSAFSQENDEDFEQSGNIGSFNEINENDSISLCSDLNKLRINILLMEKNTIKIGGKKINNNEENKNCFNILFKRQFNENT